jgi:hypothetical protein
MVKKSGMKCVRLRISEEAHTALKVVAAEKGLWMQELFEIIIIDAANRIKELSKSIPKKENKDVSDRKN